MKTTLKRLFAIALVAFSCVLIQHKGPEAAPVVALILFAGAGIIAGPAAIFRGQLGAAPDTTDLASELNLAEVLDSALVAFKRAVLPLSMFSTVFRNVQLKGNDKVEIPYFPLQGIASKDFNGSYSFSTGAGSKTDVRELTVNKRKYQPLAFTSAEIARMPALNMAQLGQMKGEKLAYDIIQDVLSLVTAANFPSVAFTGAASGFDSDDVADIRTACESNTSGVASVTDGATTNGSPTVTSATAAFNFNDIGSPISGSGIPANSTIVTINSATSVDISANATATATGVTLTLTRPVMPWPKTGRGLLLNPTYDGALLKDGNFRRDLTVAGQSTVNSGQLPRVYDFDYAASAAIPTNGENLVGMAAFKSALLVAFSPVAPADNGKIVDYRIVTDDDTGISIEYREWFDPTADKLLKVIEANYGRAPGEKHAIKRLKSA